MLVTTMSEKYLTHIEYDWPYERLYEHFKEVFHTMSEWLPEDTVANDWGINEPIKNLYVNTDEVYHDPVLREIGNDFCDYFGIKKGDWSVYATQYMASEPGVTIPWHSDNYPTLCNVNVLVSEKNSSVTFKDHMDLPDETGTTISYKTALLNVMVPHKVHNDTDEMRILFRMVFVDPECTYEALREKINAKKTSD